MNTSLKVYTVTWINPNDKQFEHCIFAEKSSAEQFHSQILSEGNNTVQLSSRPIK